MTNSNDLLNRPKTFSIVITSRCNLDCDFCVWKKSPYPRQDIDLRLLDNILAECKREGYQAVELTGGESCFHPQFKEIVGLIASYGYQFTLVSNGVLWKQYKFLIEDYKDNFNGLSISLDGPKEIHDRYRGKGSYDKVITAVNYFKGKVRLNLKCALGKHNYTYFMDVIKIALDLGIDLEFFDMVLIDGFVMDLSDYARLTSEWMRQAEKITLYSKDHNIKILIRTAGSFADRPFCESLNELNFSINYDGKIALCCAMDYPEFIVGDLNKGDDLNTILKNKLSKSKTIINGTLDLIMNKNINEVLRKDKCSMCRHFLKCKQDKGGVEIRYGE
jgi:MoaA/NifB/PqqE/SkfB family radical SAM enzyme